MSRWNTHLAPTESDRVCAAERINHLVGWIWNRNNQVCDRIGCDDQFTLLTHLAGDLQDFVPDHVAQVVATKNQVECTLDGDIVDVDGNQAVGMSGFIFQSLGVQNNVDVRNRLDLLDDFREWYLIFMQ